MPGALLQGLTRNPLADPGILGFEAGAALAVVAAIFLLGVSSIAGYVWFALAADETHVHLRHGCCLYYRVPGATKCIGCPLVTDAERARRVASDASS